jgi:hypothetical protein
MAFIQIPTEQTTAATDALLALVALYGFYTLHRYRQRDPMKTGIWLWVFGLLSFSAAMGAVVHGFEMSPGTRSLLWMPLYLSLGLTVALFPVGALYDLRGRDAVWKTLSVMAGLAAAFFVLSGRVQGGFLVFILFATAIMAFMVLAYGWLMFRGRLGGASMMMAGFVLSIIAGAAQANRQVVVTCVWTFDHNGIFHIIQTGGLIVLIEGLKAGLRSRPPSGASK